MVLCLDTLTAKFVLEITVNGIKKKKKKETDITLDTQKMTACDILKINFG